MRDFQIYNQYYLIKNNQGKYSICYYPNVALIILPFVFKRKTQLDFDGIFSFIHETFPFINQLNKNMN